MIKSNSWVELLIGLRIKYDTQKYLQKYTKKQNKNRKQILHYYYAYPQEGKFFRDSLWGVFS